MTWGGTLGAAAGSGADQVGAVGGGYAIGLLGDGWLAGAEYENGLGATDENCCKKTMHFIK